MNRFLPKKLKRPPKKLKRKVFANWKYSLAIAILIVLLWGYAAVAIQSGEQHDYNPSYNSYLDRTIIREVVDTIWVLVTAFLVFFMNAGFAMLEAGFCRIKNIVNLLSKNLIVFALSTLAFWWFGFAIMFGDGNPFFGSSGWFLKGLDNSPSTGIYYQGVYSSLNWANIPLYAKFFFQLVFAGVAATIISGAVAERIKFSAFIIFSLVLAGFIYPITGHWIWGGGWLFKMGFWDFAGSTQVHCVGGWSALVGAALLGPRLGKYLKDDLGKYLKDDKGNVISTANIGHNFGLATLGCFILWLGWFGFNPGSTLSAADPKAIAHIVVTTNTSAAMGALGAIFTFWIKDKKPDLSMMINGVLGGLVAITASCRYVSIESAAVVGLFAGIIVVFATEFLESKLKIDDPVGAIPVHLGCGIWGTLAVGLFSDGVSKFTEVSVVDLETKKPKLVQICEALYCTDGPSRGLVLGGGLHQVWIQIIGIVCVCVFTVIAAGFVWYVIDKTLGLRVTPKEEEEGLDQSIHGHTGYRGFNSDIAPVQINQIGGKK